MLIVEVTPGGMPEEIGNALKMHGVYHKTVTFGLTMENYLAEFGFSKKYVAELKSLGGDNNKFRMELIMVDRDGRVGVLRTLSLDAPDERTMIENALARDLGIEEFTIR